MGTMSSYSVQVECEVQGHRDEGSTVSVLPMLRAGLRVTDPREGLAVRWGQGAMVAGGESC